MARAPRSAVADALALLARREHSHLELRRKLQLRGHAPEEIEAALAHLATQGYLSEERAAAARVRAGIGRNLGPRRIQADLERAGLDPQAVRLHEGEEAVDWVEQARALLERRFGDTPPVDYAQWARRARFLQSRGYDSEQIRKALAAD